MPKPHVVRLESGQTGQPYATVVRLMPPEARGLLGGMQAGSAVVALALALSAQTPPNVAVGCFLIALIVGASGVFTLIEARRQLHARDGV